MAVRKDFRDLTVSDFYRCGKSVPMIRISGLWLEKLGFNVGDCVRIKCDKGQLIVSLNEEKAQEKAAEKAFMEEETRKLEKRFQKEKKRFMPDMWLKERLGMGYEKRNRSNDKSDVTSACYFVIDFVWTNVIRKTGGGND